jgi:hypothetical protein
MGTSTGYNAPTTPQWSNLKRKVTYSANNDNLTSVDIKKLIGCYISETGGKDNIVRGEGTLGGRKAAQKIARNIGDFFSSIGNYGLYDTLRRVGIDALEGKTISEIRCSILEYLGGSTSTINEIDARNALSKLFEDLFEDAVTSENIEQIMNTQSQGVELNKLLLNFFGYYLYENFCRTFYERLVSRIGEDKVNKFLNSISDYIKAALKNETLDRDISKINWAGEEGKLITDKLLEETLAVFGG